MSQLVSQSSSQLISEWIGQFVILSVSQSAGLSIGNIDSEYTALFWTERMLLKNIKV